MSFISSANLPSYFRGNLGNRRDRPTSFGWDVFIRRILNKRSNQVKVLLYRTSIWKTVEILFLCKFKCIFHNHLPDINTPFSEVSLWGEWQLSKFQQQYHDRCVCPVSEYPETDQEEKWVINPMYFLSRVGKCTSCSKPWSFMMSANICPSDWLNAESDLFSLCGQSISLKLTFRTLGWSSSGPKALEGFKPLRSLVTPSFETTMSSMKGADLLRNGTSIWSLLLNTSINWPINSSACSISEAVIPVLLLLLRGRIPWLSFFLTIDVPIEVSIEDLP